MSKILIFNFFAQIPPPLSFSFHFLSLPFGSFAVLRSVESCGNEDANLRVAEGAILRTPSEAGEKTVTRANSLKGEEDETLPGSADTVAAAAAAAAAVNSAVAGAAGAAALAAGSETGPDGKDGDVISAAQEEEEEEEEEEGRISAEPAQQESSSAASNTTEDFTLPSSALLQRSNAMIEQTGGECRSSSARSAQSRRSLPGPIRGSHGSLPSSARSVRSTSSTGTGTNTNTVSAVKAKSRLGQGSTAAVTRAPSSNPKARSKSKAKLKAKAKAKTRAKPKTKSPGSNGTDAAPAPAPDPKLLALATAGAEILPPFGVLRVTLDTEDDVSKLVEALDDGYKLIVTDLKAAATALGEKTCGLLFQALVVQGVAQKESGNQPSNTPILPPSPEKKDSIMHVGREDNVAGKGKINLKKVPGGRKAAAMLAARAMNVVQLLRIKLEDDGDLAQAKKTLLNCKAFFSKLRDVGAELGYTSLHATVAQLNAI